MLCVVWLWCGEEEERRGGLGVSVVVSVLSGCVFSKISNLQGR
jgi:hypothetical protein